MYSFAFDEDENARPLVEIIGGKDDGDIIYLNEENDDNFNFEGSEEYEGEFGGKEISHLAVKDGKFKVIPDPKNLRVILLSGASGSGKTSWAAQYIKLWEEMSPKSMCFIFSRLDSDPVLDDNIKRKQRIKLDESLITDPIEIDQFEPGDIVLFDDDTGGFNKDIEKAVARLKIALLERGRHIENLPILITSHLANSSKDKETARALLNEANGIVIYPNSGSTHNYTYVLNHYYGLSKKQVAHLMKIRSRWILIIKTVPNCIIAEHEMHLLRDFYP